MPRAVVSPARVRAAKLARLRLHVNSARVLIERQRARHGSTDLLSTALRELDDALELVPENDGKAA